MSKVIHLRERRTRPRRLTAIRVEDLGGGPYLVAHDVGIGGMQVSTRTPRWPGTLIRVRFKLPGLAQSIRATTRVVGLVEVPVGVGLSIAYLRLAREAELAIHRYVDSLPHNEQVSTPTKHILEDCNALAGLPRDWHSLAPEGSSRRKPYYL